VLFWYNKALLDQFGYDVPKTWEDYQALGDKLAKDHPGYFLGSIGDSFEGPYIYYWSGEARCSRSRAMRSPPTPPIRTPRRSTDMLDHMLANGSLTQDSVFGAPFVAKADHLVAIPGPAWYAGRAVPEPRRRQRQARPVGRPLRRSTWSTGDKVTGNVGGGVWYASSHTANPQGVKAFLQFIVSDEKTAGTGGLPAYKAAADKWLAAQAGERLLRRRLRGGPCRRRRGTVWSGWGFPNLSPETAWAKVITPGLAAGKTIADLSADWQKEMQNEAQVAGYTVN